MDWTNTWIGKAGGGFSASAGVGISSFWIKLWRMDGYKVPIHAIISGGRVGVMVQAEAGHGICILSNVRNKNDFDSITSSGLDWGITVGMKADAALKTGGKLGSIIVKASAESLSEIGSTATQKLAAKGTAKVASWACNDAVKKGVQGAMSDFELHPSKPSFLLLPSPLSLGAGGGVWYENQTLTKAGSDTAYKYVSPLWSIKGQGSNARIYLENVPEDEGDGIHFHLIQPVRGVDYVMHFSKKVGTQATNTSDSFPIRISGGNAYYEDELGIPVGQFHCIGYTRGGAFGYPSHETEVQAHKSLTLYGAISRGGGNYFPWSSKSRIQCNTDATGRLMLQPKHSAE